MTTQFCTVATNPELLPNSSTINNGEFPDGYIAFFNYDSSYLNGSNISILFDYWLGGWTNTFYGFSETIANPGGTVLKGFGWVLVQ